MRGRRVLAVLALTLGGCATPEAPVESVAPTPEFTSERALDAERPLVTAGQRGLEYHWWLVDDSSAAVARAVRASATEPIVDAETRERWRASGLRIASVPIAAVQRLHAAAPPYRAWRREWLGQAPAWAELLRGRHIEGPVVVNGAAARIGGASSILARSWIAPEPDGSAILRLELGIRVADDRARSRFLPNRPPDLEVGLLDGLLLRTRLAPGQALVITTDAPDADWSELDDGAVLELATEVDAEGGADTSAPAAEGFAPPEIPAELDVDALPNFGPVTMGPQSLGEAMLSAIDDAGVPVKTMLVLIPRLPARYSLLER